MRDPQLWFVFVATMLVGALNHHEPQLFVTSSVKLIQCGRRRRRTASTISVRRPDVIEVAENIDQWHGVGSR
jgi:hypothetical protein